VNYRRIDSATRPRRVLVEECEIVARDCELAGDPELAARVRIRAGYVLERKARFGPFTWQRYVNGQIFGLAAHGHLQHARWKRVLRALGVVLLVVAGVGCAVDRGPYVQLGLVGAWTDDDAARVADGDSVWSPLGFGLEAVELERADCPRTWYRAPRVTDCALRIAVEQRTGLHEQTGADGLADRDGRTVLIDARWHDFALVAIAAHELGHVLLDTGAHLPAGEAGVMAATAGAWQPTEADWRLACDSLGICVGGSR